MVTSLASAFTQRKVKKNLAMTGEITLRGKVLPVGGIKEKILAAKRAGINEIILSEENRKDLEKIKDIYIKGLRFHFVNTIMEVLDIALLKQKVNDPVDLTPQKLICMGPFDRAFSPRLIAPGYFPRAISPGLQPGHGVCFINKFHYFYPSTIP